MRSATKSMAICLLLGGISSQFTPQVAAQDETQSVAEDSRSSENRKGVNLEWQTDLDQAIAIARKTGKPILMEINGRPWCPPCNVQGEKIISHPDFTAWAQRNVVPLDIKVGKGYDREKGNPRWRELFKRYELSAIPAALLLDENAKQLGIIYPKTSLAQWLGAANNVLTARQLARSRDAQLPAQTLPFRLTEWNNISVPATINRSVAVNLMFHTAVDTVSVTRTTTERFSEIQLDERASVRSWGGESKSRYGSSNSLKLGTMAASKVTIFEDLHSGHQTDGKFGPEQLNSPLFRIDFDKKFIELLHSLPSDISNWDRHELSLESGMMFISGKLAMNNQLVSHRFMIHSGYSGFALLDDEFIANHKFIRQLKVLKTKQLTDSAGNKLETKQVLLPEFFVGESRHSAVPVSIFSGAIDKQKFSLLGGDFLKRYNVIFDLRSNHVYLKRNSLFDTNYFENE